MLISNRNYRHKVKSENLSIHEQCQLDLPIKINNEINTRGSPHIVPAVISNSLRFPVSIGEKQIFGVWTTFNFEELMDVIDLEEVDVENISQLQRNFYQLIFAPSKERNYDVKDIYPAFRSGYSREEKHYIVWERPQKRAKGPWRILNIVDGRIHRQEVYFCTYEVWTVHPIFGNVSWIHGSPTRIIMYYISWCQVPTRTPPPLYAILQKSFLLKDTIHLIRFPGFENILF